MEHCVIMQKAECCQCCKISKKYDRMLKKERYKAYFMVTIAFVIILCICIIVYLVNIVRELEAGYNESAHIINTIRTEMHEIKNKYDQLDRKISMTQLKVSSRQTG